MTQHTTVSSKGQMVIPAALRNRLGIKSGTRLAVTEQNGVLVVEPVINIVRRLRGSLKGGGSAMKYLLAERRKDRSL